MEKKHQEDRLEKIKKLLEGKKQDGNQLCWIKFNRHSPYKYDIENAEEDIAWTIYELERLRAENNDYKEFIDSIRDQMEKELGLRKKD